MSNTPNRAQAQKVGSFVEAGGGDYKQIPCMNDNPLWVKFLTDRIEEWQN